MTSFKTLNYSGFTNKKTKQILSSDFRIELQNNVFDNETSKLRRLEKFTGMRP